MTSSRDLQHKRFGGNICLLISQFFLFNYLDKTNFLPFILQHFMEFLCLLNTYISAHLRISYIS